MSEQNLEKTNSNPESGTLSDSPQEQFLNLKLEVEQIYGKVERLRGLLQTLVSGLVIAIAIAIGISGWFAYSLLVQEQIARQDAEKAATTAAEMLEKVTQLEEELQRQQEQLQRQQEQLQQLQAQFPEEVTALSENIEVNQQQLKLLRERLSDIEENESSQDNSDN